LQDEVAQSVKGIDWNARQPMDVLVPWIKAVAAAVLVLAVLSFVPRLHLPGFLARAALPCQSAPPLQRRHHCRETGANANAGGDRQRDGYFGAHCGRAQSLRPSWNTVNRGAAPAAWS